MHKITKHIANVYDGDDFEDLKHLAADGHQVEIEKGGIFVNGHNTLNRLVVEYLDPLERESWWRMELDCPVIQSVSQVRVARDAREAYLDMVKEVRETDPVMADELLRWPAGFARVEERSLRRRSSEK